MLTLIAISAGLTALSFIVQLVMRRGRWLAFWISALSPAAVLGLLWAFSGVYWSIDEMTLWAFASGILFVGPAIGAVLAIAARWAWRRAAR